MNLPGGLDAPESCSMFCTHEGPGSCQKPCDNCFGYHDESEPCRLAGKSL